MNKDNTVDLELELEEAQELLNRIELGEKKSTKGNRMMMECADPGCKKRVDEMHNDIYKDDGIRDRAKKAVCENNFTKCQKDHDVEAKSYASKKLFWSVFGVIIISVGATLITLSVGVANSASEKELTIITKDLAAIKSLIEKDSAVLKCRLEQFIAATQISQKELKDRMTANEKEDNKCHRIKP